MSGILGNWWGSGASAGQPYQNPLADYAQRMRAAGANAPVQSPLVAGYTPPVYQTTPPHVDIDAVIAAMNAKKAAAAPQATAPNAPQMPPMYGGGEGLGEAGSGTSAGMEMSGLEQEAEHNVENGAAGLAMGGPVMPQNMTGPDPMGPDQGYAPIQQGEYVIRKSAAQKVGDKTLAKINAAGSDAKDVAKKVADRVAAKHDGRADGKSR